MYDFLFEDRDPVAEPGTLGRHARRLVDGVRPGARRPRARRPGLRPLPEPEATPRPRVLRELAQTRAGWAAGSQFVFSQHCKSLRDLGVPRRRSPSIPTGRPPPASTPTERLVLAYTDCLVYDHGRVPDGLFDALQAHLSDEEILELTYIAALYLQHAVMSRALRTEFDDRPEPVVEVSGPTGRFGHAPVTAAHVVSPDDEQRHPPEAEDLWNESYYADFVHEDGSWGGWLRLGLYPNRRWPGGRHGSSAPADRASVRSATTRRCPPVRVWWPRTRPSGSSSTSCSRSNSSASPPPRPLRCSKIPPRSTPAAAAGRRTSTSISPGPPTARPITTTSRLDTRSPAPPTAPSPLTARR